MKKTFLLLLVIFCSGNIYSQFIKERSVDVSVGLGISTPLEDIDVTGYGFYLQGEYVLTTHSWLDLRPYAGLILTRSEDRLDEFSGATLKADTNVFMVGGKIRVKAPIPWFAPYIEGGIGASFGSVETITPTTNISKSGIIYHIPVTVGLQLGKKQNFDFAFSYYFHPNAEQLAGAVAIGFSIPIN
jgi:hypothetical protein